MTFGFNRTAHLATQPTHTIDLLRTVFENRIISRNVDVNWPPRSCDLTPLDYFLVTINFDTSIGWASVTLFFQLKQKIKTSRKYFLVNTKFDISNTVKVKVFVWNSKRYKLNIISRCLTSLKPPEISCYYEPFTTAGAIFREMDRTNLYSQYTNNILHKNT